MLPDYHLHSRFSGDSDTPERKIIEQTLALGMTSFCITDHNDYDYPEEDIFNLDVEAYFSAWKKLQQEYSDKIHIGIGIEAGLEPQFADKIHTLISSHPFDFVIGSSHLVNRKDPYYKEFFQGREDKDCFEEYFLSIIENLKVIQDFDVYGHLDYIVRYPENKDKNYSYKAFSDYIDEILRSLIHNGKGIEINAGGYRNGLSFANPHPDILKRYRELGGEILTVGSDAHTPEYIGKYFDLIEDTIKACGFKYYTVFNNRKPSFVKL